MVHSKIIFYLLLDGCSCYTWTPKAKSWPKDTKNGPKSPYFSYFLSPRSHEPPRTVYRFQPPVRRRRLARNGARKIYLRVPTTQIWRIYGFSVRNRKYGLGYMLRVWVFGALGSWNLKRASSWTTVLLKGLLFRFHVSLGEYNHRASHLEPYLNLLSLSGFLAA